MIVNSTGFLIRLFVILFILLPLTGQSTSYPIKLVSGVLVSQANIEGNVVDVIIDSGAPGLVLNSKYYSPNSGNQSNLFVGVNGHFECPTYEVKHWSFLDVNFDGYHSILSDLSFLENSLHREIHALVGLSVFTDYYVSMDFDHMTVTLTRKMNLDKNDIIRFQYVDQLPVITCEVNGEKKILGIDTGSEINYLFSISSKEKKSLLSRASPLMVIGTENKIDVKYSLPLELQLDDEFYSSTFVIDQEGPQKFQHDDFDGFLGLEFLDQFNITIHPGKQLIVLSPRQIMDSNESLVDGVVGQ